MSDRSPCTLTIYSVDGDLAKQAIFDVLDEHYFDYNLSTGRSGEVASFALGEGIVADDVSIGTADEVAEWLATFPIAFDVYQDAKYEYDGMGFTVIPGLGTFDYTGGGSGEAMVRVYDIDKYLDAYDKATSADEDGDPDSATYEEAGRSLAEALDGITGRAYRKAVKRLLDAMPDDASERTILRPVEDDE